MTWVVDTDLGEGGEPSPFWCINRFKKYIDRKEM
jgi:hypothetical protein